jgi:hypothetical protein
MNASAFTPSPAGRLVSDVSVLHPARDDCAAIKQRIPLALVAAFFRCDTIASMSDCRNKLTRNLAEIDQLLAEAEDIAAGPEDDDRDEALELLIEFQLWKRVVEVELTGE